jgi:hypothetical protein
MSNGLLRFVELGFKKGCMSAMCLVVLGHLFFAPIILITNRPFAQASGDNSHHYFKTI